MRDEIERLRARIAEVERERVALISHIAEVERERDELRRQVGRERQALRTVLRGEWDANGSPCP